MHTRRFLFLNRLRELIALASFKTILGSFLRCQATNGITSLSSSNIDIDWLEIAYSFFVFGLRGDLMQEGIGSSPHVQLF